ncbi:ABC transporter substrate-binding protein [Nocardioides speluncae]|uniref:ABC transporter substrate-binding protein n=1 Tax=Nocardioides speluncae TaxID=2670337 RepID=UPI0012B182E2|nr:ABC transporter substrate-binding protein [Nocardioides speluncae]
MKRTATRLGVALAVASLLMTGCGRDDDNGSGAAPGVTDEPCPEAVDKEKGCIYLGVLSDFTGVFKGVGVPFSEGQKAFWKKVNEDGGIGDYEVDVTKYAKDSAYDPDKHAQLFGEIQDDILAVAQSLGTAHTNAILGDAEKEDIVIAPASLASSWQLVDNVLEVGSNYCGDAMNSVDYAVDELGAKGVAVAHFPGDYGDDAAVGAKVAAEARGIDFTDVPSEPGAADKQASVVAGILKADPDVVLVATGPIEMASIVGGLAQKGFTGKIIGSIPTWNIALLGEKKLVPALQALYLQATSFQTWEADTPGYEAMRAAAGETPPSDWYALGYGSGYVMQAVIEKAIEDDDLTREGMLNAAKSLDGVESEGMLPEGAANYAGDPNDAVIRETAFNAVDPTTASGVKQEVAPFVGPTAKDHDFSESACYEQY